MGPELLLDNAEDFGLFFATSLDNDTSVTIARDNIGISISNSPLFIEQMEAIFINSACLEFTGSLIVHIGVFLV